MIHRLCLILFVSGYIAGAQNANVLIHIKLMNGRTGRPMKNQQVGLEDGANYHDISVRTNQFGVASLYIRPNAVILVHNTDHYVNCADEPGGLIHNDFKVSEILSKGVVEPVVQPNLCGKTSAIATPGELILFVRPWAPGEKI